MELKNYAKTVAERVNSFMSSYLHAMDGDAIQLKYAMSYGVLLGGKRARPLLVYATGQALGVPLERLDYAASAIECIHAYSLIHDDMPEMDNDRLRRGHETVHVKFSQSTALLAGDALQALAFEILSDKRSGLSDSSVVRLVGILAARAGYRGMCGGQALDLEAEGRKIGLEDLKKLHSKKTGALIRAAVLMGAACADDVSEETVALLDDYASWTGLAFQVWDDVLDVIGDTSVMGKRQGADIDMQKSTYPALLGLDEAKTYALDCASKAIEALRRLEDKLDVSMLKQFALFVVNRDH